MEIKVQPVSPEHKTDWKRLWDGYLTFYESSVEDHVYDTTFERLLSKDDYQPRGFIAIIDDTPVGLVHYLFHRHCWKQNNVCYLQDLFADPSTRGVGVGRALIEAPLPWDFLKDGRPKNTFTLSRIIMTREQRKRRSKKCH